MMLKLLNHDTVPAVMTHDWRMIHDPSYKEGYFKCLNEAKTWQGSQSGQDREGMRWPSDSDIDLGIEENHLNEKQSAIFLCGIDWLKEWLINEHADETPTQESQWPTEEAVREQAKQISYDVASEDYERAAALAGAEKMAEWLQTSGVREGTVMTSGIKEGTTYEIINNSDKPMTITLPQISSREKELRECLGELIKWIPDTHVARAAITRAKSLLNSENEKHQFKMPE